MRGPLRVSMEGGVLDTILRWTSRGAIALALALALACPLTLAAAVAARAQNIPEPDPNLNQTWSGEVVYKSTEGTNWGVLAVYNKDQKYAKGFKIKMEEFKKLEVKEGDQVEVTWSGPRNDRTERKDVKIKKTSGSSG